MYKAFAIAAIILLPGNTCTAQLQYRFKTWDRQGGLPSNSCLSTMQDGKGYMWIATMNGLRRFNGNAFREIGRYGNLPIEGEIRRVIEDKEGIYWLASYEKGLVSIDFKQPQKNQIQAFNPATLPGQVCPPFQTVNRLLDDGTGHIWVGTESNGLYRFHKKSKRFVRWQFNHPYSNFPEFIRCLYQCKDGTVWVGIVNGLVYINPATGKTTYPETSYAGIHYSYAPTVRSICHWNMDTFAVATDRGAHFYLSGPQKFVPVFPAADSAQYKQQEYHDVIKFSDEELWFATTNRGIWYANIRQKQYRYSWQSPFADETIGRYPVLSIYKDRNASVWISHAKGLSYFNPKNTRFKNLPFAFHVNQPPAKDFLIAGNKGIIIIRPDSLFTWQIGSGAPKGAMLFGKDENAGGGLQVWWHKRLGYILMNNRGVFHADTLKRRALPLFLKKDLPEGFQSSSVVLQILVDTLERAEQWWFGPNEYTVLYRYDWRKKSFTAYHLFNDGDSLTEKSSFYFSKMLKDSKGGIWIATRKHGLFYLPDRTKDSFIHFAIGQPAGKQLPGNYIEDLVLDNNNELWATVRNIGLVNINWRNPQPLSYTIYAKEKGLTYLNLSQIQVDRKNNLWISSPNGLYHFDQQRKWFSHFGQPNGIRDAVLTLGSAKDSAGYLYFASANNLLYFNPADITNANDNTSIKLRSVTVNGRTIAMEHLQKLVLKPIENTLEFEFDILDYDNPGGHYMLCKLDGYEASWQLLQDVYRQTHRSLPGGEYTFRIKKLTADGTAGAETSLPVTIGAFYYHTAWFKIVVLLLAALLVYAALKLYTHRKLQKQRAAMKQKEAIEGERLRISTELHDDLGGELSAIRLVSEMAQTNTLQNPQLQFSKISASSAELVQKMNEIVWALNINNDTLQSLISYMHRYAVRYSEDVGLTCRFKQPEYIPVMEVEGIMRRNIFLLAKEAMNNVAKHAAATCVTITIEIHDYLCLTIQDNGKGIAPENLAAGMGNGLFTMQKRIKDLNGTVQITNQAGTLLQFRIPLAKTHTKV